MKNVSLRKLVRTGTFLDLYMQFMSPQETAVEYDFWTGMWLMSLALGRTVIVPRPRAPVHMNQMMFLIAESGLTRKSTAVSNATTIGRLFNERIEESSRFDFITSRATAEALEQTLQIRSAEFGCANVVISVSEAIRLLGRERYLASMPGMLTDLYDSPQHHSSPGTLYRGSISIRNVYMPVLSASTPSWLARSINPDVIEGGFTSRCLFIYAEKPKRRVAWPGQAKDTGTVKPIVDALVRIHEQRSMLPVAVGFEAGMCGVRLEKAAMEAFEAWYHARRFWRDPYRSTFQAREDSHILRTAALLSINDNRWVISKQDINTAVQLIEEIRESSAALFEGGVAGDKLSIGIDRIRALLLAAGKGGLQHSPLYYKVRTHLSREEFSTVIDIMHQLEMVQKFEQPIGKRGPAPMIYRATTKLAGSSVYESVIKELQP